MKAASMETPFYKADEGNRLNNDYQSELTNNPGKVFNLSRKTEDAINIIQSDIASLQTTGRQFTKGSIHRHKSAMMKTNPYMSTVFRESELFEATN